ncbi:hypothetical protein [Nitrososphaera sp. AFS]|uniref:hypothetical protein n=1 Tax=Nitrososphaera sp. AFS TaxID=2301191 RepID=UPI0013924264|nr:hypothetical protein [Nitrososphaera sp. AFS]NAL76859.1 hypothetical protein [Nitrososphaera sp. AFS]
MGVVIHGHIFTTITVYHSRCIVIDTSVYRCSGYIAHLDGIHSKIVNNLCAIDRSTQRSGINDIQEELTSG